MFQFLDITFLSMIVMNCNQLASTKVYWDNDQRAKTCGKEEVFVLDLDSFHSDKLASSFSLNHFMIE